MTTGSAVPGCGRAVRAERIARALTARGRRERGPGPHLPMFRVLPLGERETEEETDNQPALPATMVAMDLALE